jgi:universal stress protein A
MKKYQHILATLDLFQNKTRALEAALQWADVFKAKLSVLYIVTHRLYNSYAFLGEMDIEGTIVLQAKEKMQILCKKYRIAEENQIIKIGNPKSDTLELARDLKADLVVAGSHHHNILGMLGSTANAIVNNAHCDVLLIKED